MINNKNTFKKKEKIKIECLTPYDNEQNAINDVIQYLKAGYSFYKSCKIVAETHKMYNIRLMSLVGKSNIEVL